MLLQLYTSGKIGKAPQNRGWQVMLGQVVVCDKRKSVSDGNPIGRWLGVAMSCLHWPRYPTTFWKAWSSPSLSTSSHSSIYPAYYLLSTPSLCIIYIYVYVRCMFVRVSEIPGRAWTTLRAVRSRLCVCTAITLAIYRCAAVSIYTYRYTCDVGYFIEL